MSSFMEEDPAAAREAADIRILFKIRTVLGSRYKAAIRRAWETGRYDENHLREWALDLQRMRNARGPSWLCDVRVTSLACACGKTPSGFETVRMLDMNDWPFRAQRSGATLVPALWLGADGGQQMHLTRAQALELANLLTHFWRTGKVGKATGRAKRQKGA